MNYSEIKNALLAHGECRPQTEEEWKGKIPLPEDIKKFYREIGPVDISIDTGANPIFIPSLANLWERQAGYRWNGLSGEEIEDWDPEWIVVADEGADPYVFYQGKILFGFHGDGSWDFEEEYPDIFTMAKDLLHKDYSEDED